MGLRSRLRLKVSRDEFMEKVTKTVDSGELTVVEQHNLLSVAHSNAIGAQHASWCIISSVEQKEEGNEDNVILIKDYVARLKLHPARPVMESSSSLIPTLSPHLQLQSPRSSTLLLYYDGTMWSLKLDLRRMQLKTPWWHTKLLRLLMRPSQRWIP